VNIERFLSRKRTKIANKLMASQNRNSRILDIGCGEFPYLLDNVDFNEKYGIDKIVDREVFNSKDKGKIFVRRGDIEKDGLRFFEDDYFDVITMLAVFEHLEPRRLLCIIEEIKRILKLDGVLILTTPAPWTNMILQLLASLRLINPAMIKEHKGLYSVKEISSILSKGGFLEENMRFGSFEAFMNIWAFAIKK